jgi:hypothetical protein
MLPLLLPAVAGLVLSAGLQLLVEPRGRPMPAAWAVSAGIWLLGLAALTALLSRPGLAAAALCAGVLALVLISNAKWRALQEPFLFQDYDYFVQAVRHPRLFLPFLGWGRAAVIAVAAVAAVWLGWTLEPPWRPEAGGGLALAAMGVAGAVLLAAGHRALPRLTLDPGEDLARHGLLAFLWSYGMAERTPPPTVRGSLPALCQTRPPERPPHVVVVQSESFFDPRGLWPHLRAEVLADWERLAAEAVLAGSVDVPVWGANTVRSELEFLSGVPGAELGIHRFNPYRRLGRSLALPSLAGRLGALGYRCVAVHPYPAAFYERDRVFPVLGFDAFVDIRDFAGAPRFGPYVADAAVTERVGRLLDEADGPLFVFVITMENHGPLHLEAVGPADVKALYTRAPPPGCEELTVYLRHLRNASRMAGRLAQRLAAADRPGWLAWYGDHVPIMPAVYEHLGAPDGRTPYLLWHTEGGTGARRDLPLHDLGATLLAAQKKGDGGIKI